MPEIHSSFFRESRSFYNLKSLCEKLGIAEEEGKKVISRLRSAAIIKPTTKQSFDMGKLQDSEEIISDERIFSNYENGFTFNFVGIAYTENCILKCYPKYIDSENVDYSHFKKVLRAIQKYNDEKQLSVPLFNAMERTENFNRLAVELYLLRDYYANGIYTNQKTVIETNGSGLIDWDRTINETFAIIKNSNPYYIDLQTVEIQDNAQDFFRQLHECVLTKCSDELEQLGLLDLFDIAPVKLNPMSVCDFGTVDYIKYRIEQEIKNQFVTKKQNLLKTLYVFISETESSTIQDNFSFFGTNAFNMVWEKACSAIFDDVKENYLQLIENAKWHFKNTSKNFETKDTLKPDTICLYDNHFYILDSKYYFYEKSEIQGLPGIQDIIKQFAYHKAFYNFLLTSKIENVSNSFLVPKKSSLWHSEKMVSNEGEVNINLMQDYYLDRLAPIQLIALNPEYVFNNYLADKKCMDLLKEIKAYKITSYSEDDENTRYCAVGYLRLKYFEKIKSEKLQNFIFYYYQKLSDEVIQMHPKLPVCTRFIGYTEEKTDEFITGNIVGSLQIQDKTNLKIKLFNRGIEHEPTQNNYYCFDIANVKIIKKSEIHDFNTLLDTDENKSLKHEYSPKVIKYEKELS